ncbi:MAG: hypothetical protein M0P27_05985, partial [Bacteroidales bacterium]|nr:hypothetical protein [Bacteroidales bacterium]
ITVTGGESDGTGQACGLFKYSTDTRKVSKLADFHDSYSFSDVVDLKDKRDQLYVVYYHPYNKLSQVKMTVKLEEKLDFNVGMFQMTVDNLVNYKGSLFTCIPDMSYLLFKEMKGKTTSGANKLTYTSSLRHEGLEYGYDAFDEWILTLEIDTKTNKIISGSAQEVKTRFYRNTSTLRYRYTTSVNFGNIPFQKISSGRHTYSVTSADGKMENFVTAFSYKTEENLHGTINTEIVNSWEPNAGFSITIQMDKLPE